MWYPPLPTIDPETAPGTTTVSIPDSTPYCREALVRSSQESVYDFSFLIQALTAYEEAMESMKMQVEHDFASSAWSPQLADLH